MATFKQQQQQQQQQNANNIGGRLFTMIDFIRNDPVMATKLLELSSESESGDDNSLSDDSSGSSDDSSVESRDNNSPGHAERHTAVQFKEPASNRNSVTSRHRTVSISQDSNASRYIRDRKRERHQQRRRTTFAYNRQRSKSLTSLYPTWHPLSILTNDQRQRYFYKKKLASYLPINEKTRQAISSSAKINQESTNNKVIMSASFLGVPTGPGSVSTVPSVIAPAAESASAPGITSANVAGSANATNAANLFHVEIGPGGVPPTSLKTVRRRAMAQLQACETQITTYKAIWLKTGGKEGGIPSEVDFLCADIEHLLTEAAAAKQPVIPKKSLAAQSSIAAPLHHQRSSLSKPFQQQESLASQQSSKQSRPPLGPHVSKKYGSEVTEIRRMTNRQQLRQHLQGLYDARGMPLKMLDARQLIAKSLRILERLSEYDNLYEMLRPNLQAIAGAVSRYCTSFIHEIENVQVDCIWDYNNTINSLQKGVDTSFARIEDARKALERKEKVCAATLICENDSETSRMISDEGVEQMEAIVKRLKQWVIEDERFEVRLRETLRQYIQRQKELGDSVKTDQRKKDELTRLALRREFKASLIDDDGKIHVDQGQRLQKMLETLQDNENTLNAKVQAKVEELKQLRYENMSAHVDGSMEPVMSNIETLKRQLSGTKKRIRAIQLKMTLLESEIVGISHAKEANLEIGRRELCDAKKYNKMASDAGSDLRQMDAKIRAVVRIIDLKRNPDILKRMFYQQQAGMPNVATTGLGVPYEPADTDHLMTTAISLIANEIGHHLPELYRRLPFSPSRSAGRRKRDLMQLGCREITTPPFPNYPTYLPPNSTHTHIPTFPLSTSNAVSHHHHNSATFIVTSSGATATSAETTAELRKLAFQVLRKWRRLNKNVTVMQLAEALRSINQTRLADTIEAVRIQTLGLPAIHSRARILATSTVF